jgi:hypothetical protein
MGCQVTVNAELGAVYMDQNGHGGSCVLSDFKTSAWHQTKLAKAQNMGVFPLFDTEESQDFPEFCF